MNDAQRNDVGIFAMDFGSKVVNNGTNKRPYSI